MPTSNNGMATTDTKAWYRQFWPWFLIILPASVVVASMVTIWLALERPHHMVVDDYYKEGKAINQSLARSELAGQLGLSASLNLQRTTEAATEQLQIDLIGLSGNMPEILQLKLIHPANSGQDIVLELHRVDEGVYRAKHDMPRQRWYIQLTGTHGDKTWRLQGEADFSVRHQALLSP